MNSIFDKINGSAHKCFTKVNLKRDEFQEIFRTLISFFRIVLSSCFYYFFNPFHATGLFQYPLKTTSSMKWVNDASYVLAQRSSIFQLISTDTVWKSQKKFKYFITDQFRSCLLFHKTLILSKKNHWPKKKKVFCHQCFTRSRVF